MQHAHCHLLQFPTHSTLRKLIRAFSFPVKPRFGSRVLPTKVLQVPLPSRVEALRETSLLALTLALQYLAVLYL